MAGGDQILLNDSEDLYCDSKVLHRCDHALLKSAALSLCYKCLFRNKKEIEKY